MVYHLDEEEEKLTEMVSSLNEDGDIEMETDHFSIYIIVNFETTGIEVNVSHWANVIDFTLENGGLEDIASKEFRNTHMNEFEINRTPFRNYINPDETNNTLNELKIRLSELKYSSSFNKNMIVYGFIVKNNTRKNGIEFDATKYEKVPDKLYPGMIEKDDGTLGYPTSHKEIYSGNTYVLPGWATKGIPYTILLDKLSKINNVDEKNYSIDTITFITADSETDNINRKEIVFKNNGDSYEVISGELPNNPSIDNLDNLNGINRDDTLLELNKYNEVKFEYIETTGESEVDTAFHDYNLGEIYKDNKKSSSNYKPFNGINAARVYRKDENGIEIDTINYGGTKDRVYVGGGSLNLGFSPFDTDEYNGKIYKPTDKINKNFNNPVLGSVKKRINKGDYNIFNYKDPGLFYPENLYSIYTNSDNVETEMIAKEYITGYKIGFKRSGDTYVIQNVKNDSGDILDGLDELDVLKYTGPKYYLNYPLYSNMFWPLDSLGNRENGCQDELKPLLKDDIYDKNNTHNFSENDEDKSGNKEVRHNWLFGMNFDLTFNVKEYTGPLNYYFRGDDDLFVYIDGHLMVDLGGIHSSWGKFVDVRQFLLDEGLAKRRNENDPDSDLIPLVNGEEVEDHEYTMSVFYTERGGTGSCCYMMYTLPKVKPVEVPIYDTLQHTISKTWNDGGNTANRPSEIGIQIYQNGKAYGEQMTLRNSDINGDNQTWRYVWNNLPKFDDDGNQYSYEVKEVELDSNKYTDKYVQTYDNSSINNTNLINTLVTNDVSVTKVWQELPNEDAKRPVKVALYKYSYSENNSSDESDEEDAGESEEGDAGSEEEGSSSKENGEDTAIESGGNSTDISSDDTSSDSTINGSIEIDIDDLAHIRDALDEEDIELVDKTMLGYQNIDPIVELNAENNYTYKWGPLPAYENNGDKILYLPYEVEVDSNNNIIRRLDNSSTTSDKEFYVTYDGNTITNTYNMMALNATKVWEDSDSDELAHRPTSVDVQVNQILGSEVVADNYKNATLQGDNWSCTFNNIPIKADGGEDYTYEVLEVYGGNTLLNNGTITIDNKYQYVVTYSPSVLNGDTREIKITNTWQPVEKLDVTVEKIWKLDDNGEKPLGTINEIQVALYRDGTMVGSPVSLNATSTNINNNWAYTWKGLEKYKNILTKETYNYTVRELKGNEIVSGIIRLDDVNKYDVTYKDDIVIENGIKTEITNSFKAIPKITITVLKHWNDDVAKGATDQSYVVKAGRPKFIKVALYQDGVKYGNTLELSADANGKSDSELPWKGEWTNLPEYHVVNGEEVKYTYTVKELDINDNVLGNGMTCRFDGEHKYEVKYGGTLNSPPDTDITKNITNTHVKDPVKDLYINKYWKDENGKKLDFNTLEGTHPTDIKVKVYRSVENESEKEFKTVTLNKSNNWSAIIENVPINDLQDRPYTYRAVELDASGKELAEGTYRLNGLDKFKVDYSTSLQGPDDKLNRIIEFFDITNNYIAPELIDVTVNKQWAGEGTDYTNKRPTWVWFKLFRRVPGGIKEAVDKDLVVVEPDSDGNWSHTWENLKKYDLNDKEYEYSVTEYYTDYMYYLPPIGEQVSIKEMPLDKAVRLEGPNRDKYLVSYSPSVDTQDGKLITVTNTYEEPAMDDLIIEKEWVSISGNDHPSEIEAIVHGQSGNKSEDTTEIVKLNTSNDFKTTLRVPIYDKYGRIYTYSVYEYVDNREIKTNSIIKLDNKKYQVKIDIRSSDGAFIISNIYQPPETVEVSVNKIWDDTTDLRNEHLEHADINVRLYQNNDVIMESIPLNEDNKYSWSTQLPKYREDADETPYIYRFVELDKDGKELKATDKCRFNGTDQYSVDYKSSGNNSETWTITNTFVPPARTQVNVNKVWDDNNETYRRPDSIQVQLYVREEGSNEPEEVVGYLETLNEANGWSHTWDGLLEHTTDDREVKYVYSVKEMHGSQPIEETIRFNGTDKYQVSYSSDEYGYNNTITNKFITPDTTTVKVTKHWVKDGVEHEPNVNEIKVQLYADEDGYEAPKKYGDPVILNKDNNWAYEWNNLLVVTNDDRETPYTYTVKELFNEQELENGAQVRFNGVDKYEVSYEKSSSSNNYDLNITNTWIEPPVLNLEIVKDWGETPEANRLGSISINLYQKDKDNNEVKFGDTIVLNAENNWHTSLVVLAQDLQDRDYTYRIAEVINGVELEDKEIIRFNGNDKYTVEYFKGILDTKEHSTLTVKNTFIPRDAVDVNVTKTWIDNDASTRPASITVELLRDGERFTQDGITTKIELNADNNWKYTWNNLYQAELKDDFNDADYEYSVVEVFNDRDLKENEIVRLNGVDKYRVHYSSDADKKNWTITNSFVNPTMKKIEVKKVWNGGDDSKRSESVTINLYRDNTLFDSVELNASNDWHYEWNLEAERLDDSLYEFTLFESLNGVNLKDTDIVKFNGKSKYVVSYKVDKETVVEEIPREDGTLTNDSYTITNTYKAPDTKVISVEKIWDESDRAEGKEIIHTDITINLYRDEVLFDTVVLNDSNEYKYNWTVDAHQEDENDTPYTYRLAEVFNGQDLSQGDKVRFNGVDKYEVSYANEADNWKIINKYLPPIMKEITVEKKWENDDESKRPVEVIIHLYQDTTLFDTASLNVDNGWSYKWSVPVERNDDTLFDYSIKEVFKDKDLESGDIIRLNGVDKYQVSYPENTENKDNFIINNKYIEPTMKEITVEKRWENDVESTRPDEIVVNLYQDTTLFDTVSLNSNNGWKYTWSVQVERNDDTLFDYSIKEVFKGRELESGDIVRLNGVDKYEVGYPENEEDKDTFIITNTYVEPTMKDIYVEKVWIDNDVTTRPDGIEVGLYQDSELIETVTLNDNNKWKHTWSVQVERNDDSLYEYEIAEMFNGKRLEKGSLIRFNGIDKYLVDYEDISEDSYRITNRFIEPDMTSVRVEKVWVDTAKIARPTEITVRLYQDNLVYDTVILNEGNNWNTTWIVPVNRLDDSEYVYSVREVYDDKDLTEGDKVTFGTKNEYVVSYSSISENNFRITNTQEVTNTPPGGGGGSKEPEPPKEPELPKEDVPETPRPENPVPNIQRSIKDPLIRIYDIMDNMIPMTQTPTEINDNETPLYGLPGTGDKTNLGKYILLCLISTFGLLGLAFKNKKEENED